MEMGLILFLSDFLFVWFNYFVDFQIGTCANKVLIRSLNLLVTYNYVLKFVSNL